MVVEIRAVHDGTFAYFSFVWDDPTRSMKHLPLAKTRSGWRLLQDKFDHEDANAFYQDKFAVLLAPAATCSSPATTRSTPARNPAGQAAERFRPRAALHHRWRLCRCVAVAGFRGWRRPAGWTIAHFGPPRKPRKANWRAKAPIRAVMRPIPASALQLNFEPRGPGGYEKADPAEAPAKRSRQRNACARPDRSRSRSRRMRGSRWWMTEAETDPLTQAEDDKGFRSAPSFPASSWRATIRAIAGTFTARPNGRPGAGRWKWCAASTPKANTTSRSEQGAICACPSSTIPNPATRGISGQSPSR